MGAVEVIKIGLLEKLRDIMDPAYIFSMSDAGVATIAAKTEESRIAREELKLKLKVLKRESKTCKEFAALHANGTARV